MKSSAYPYIVWHKVAEINSGHGINFWHEATGQFDVAYIEGYGKPTREGEFHVQIITRRPKRFARLPWKEIVKEVRAAVIACLKEPRLNSDFRLGRVEISIGG